MSKLRHIIRVIFHGVPMLTVMMGGGALALLADLTDWQWAERAELALRETVERMESNLNRR